MTAPKPNPKRGAAPQGAAAAKPRRAAAKPASGREPVPSPAPAADDPGRFSRTEWLAGIVRERILNGTYQPGERIREVQLRGEFGFSNGPIREALQAVVADGLAERAPWQGVRVKSLDERELIDLFQVRLALLEYAAELAARQRTDALARSAAALKRELDTGFDAIEHSGSHPSFHGRLSHWLLNAAGNAALHEIWDKTMQQTLIYVNASLVGGRGRKSRALINTLIDAICAGDVPAARTAARDLTKQTLADLGVKGTL